MTAWHGVMWFTLAALPLACGSEATNDEGSGGAAGNQATHCPTKLDAILDTVDVLTAAHDALLVEVAQACAAIATALGQSGVPDVSAPTMDDLTIACSKARAGIQGGGSATVAVGGPRCAIDHEGQQACELSLSNGACDQDPLSRCDPAALSAMCSGQCGGSCTSGGTQCVGECSGVCTGTCSGACTEPSPSGGCEGACSGMCMGTCAGICTASAPGATCSGWCKGACSATTSQPGCEEELAPPNCAIEPDCAALCNGRGLAGASCGMPVVAADAADTILEAALEDHLPAVLHAAALCPWLLGASQAVAAALPLNGMPSGPCPELVQRIPTIVDTLGSLAAICEATLTLSAPFGG